MFHSRHLLDCSLVLLVVAAFAAGPAVHEPFARLFSHGRITGGEIADVGSTIAPAICTVASIVTATGAWDAYRAERPRYRSLHDGVA